MTITDRRTLIAGASVTLAAPLILRPAKAESPDLAEPVTMGLTYFRQRASLQAELCADLTAAIASGDVGAAQLAYEAARPPYEEIEVHAGLFPDIDADIDARPYAIDGGEDSVAFRGFHRIEALIYRDGDQSEALPYAEELEGSVAALSDALEDTARFAPADYMAGLIALPEEVAAKKISSEEETWSDLSLIIFRHNFIGVQSQFAPLVRLVPEDTANRAAMAFAEGQAVLEAFFEGPRVARYSDVRTRERAAIAIAARRMRAAMEEAAEALKLI